MGEGENRYTPPQETKGNTEGIILEKAPLREDVKLTEIQLVDINKGNEELEEMREDMEEDDEIHYVDLDGGDLDMLKENGFRHDGIASYLISPISERDWTSDHYFNCTAMVAIGRDKETGKEISFLSHQDPAYFVDGDEEQINTFSRELKASMEGLKEKSQDGTVEVLLLGGNFSTTTDEADYKHHQYKKSIEKLRGIVHKSLGFDPKVLTGPNNRVGSETIVSVETQKRRVWVERSKQPPEFDQSYLANDLDKVEERWEGNEGN